MTKNINQLGFGGVEIILICGVLILTGLIAYFGYQVATKLDPAVPWSNTSAKNVIKTTSAATPAAIDDLAASKVVSAFYAQYFAGVTKPDLTDPTASAGKSAVAHYGTAKFITDYNNFRDSDPVLCAQDSPNALPVVTSHKLRGNTALVAVQETWDSSSPTNLSVTVVEQNGLKVDSVTCPAVQ